MSNSAYLAGIEDGQAVSQHDPNKPILPSSQSSTQKGYASLIRKLLFLGIVIIPSLLVSGYYIFIASDQYKSEVRMVVRTIGVGRPGGVSDDDDSTPSIFASSLSQDSHIAANFIESLEIVRRLNERLDLLSLFSDPNIDYLSRLKADATLDELYEYWLGQVLTYVDGPSGIIVLEVRAFAPDEAKMIAEAALDETNKLVDQLSDRAKRDLVSRAQVEVRKAFEAYNETLIALRNHQNETGILDPISNARLIGEILSRLITEKLSVETQLEVLQESGVRDSSTIRQLKELKLALENQIADQKNAISGSSNENNDNQLSRALVGFSRLETNRLVSKAIYESAQRNLDVAQSTAIRRTTYLAVFSVAQSPQKAEYPKRYSTALLLILGCLTLWGTIMLTWASVEDHRR